MIKHKLIQLYYQKGLYFKCLQEIKRACRIAKSRCETIDPMDILEIIKKFERIISSLETENKKGETT